MTTAIIPDRLKLLDTIGLDHGAHDSWAEGHCAMEVAAWLAGEDHSDAPVCVCPVLAAFVRRWNDDLDDDGRQRLKPFLPRLVGTAGDGQSERRGWMAADWLVREYTPAWLELAGIAESSAALRALPSLTDLNTLDDARPALNTARDDAARSAAWAAAWAAARDAAGDAAWAAAGAAAWAAARDAARAAARDAAWAAAWAAAGDAARDAARAAARAAARDAARDAARAAARDALAPTREGVQASAFALLDRMIGCP